MRSSGLIVLLGRKRFFKTLRTSKYNLIETLTFLWKIFIDSTYKNYSLVLKWLSRQKNLMSLQENFIDTSKFLKKSKVMPIGITFSFCMLRFTKYAWTYTKILFNDWVKSVFFLILKINVSFLKWTSPVCTSQLITPKTRTILIAKEDHVELWEVR